MRVATPRSYVGPLSEGFATRTRRLESLFCACAIENRRCRGAKGGGGGFIVVGFVGSGKSCGNQFFTVRLFAGHLIKSKDEAS